MTIIPQPDLSSAPKHIKYLDGWRGVAILFVLVSHFIGIPWLDFGQLGVDVFFVLSGLLMAKILFIDVMPIGMFYRRRISRIVPLFALFVATVYIGGWIAGKDIRMSEVVSTLFFLRTYLPVHPSIWQASVPIGHLWSLNVEEHSYLILSLIAVPLLLRRYAIFVLALLGFATQLMLLFYIRHAASAPPSFALRTECAAGFILYSASFRLARERWNFPRWRWVAPITFAIATGCYASFAPWWGHFFTPVLLAISVNYLVDAPERIKNFLSSRMLCLLGFWSYSIYVWQQPFYHWRHAMMPGLALVLAVAMGLASFYLYENPTRQWLNKRWKGRDKSTGRPKVKT